MPGRVDWDNFGTVERQRAALAWAGEIFRLIIERNDPVGIVGMLHIYVEACSPDLWPDRKGALPITGMLTDLHDNFSNMSRGSDRMLYDVINGMLRSWIDDQQLTGKLVQNIRNVAPQWQVNKDEIEAFAAVFLT